MSDEINERYTRRISAVEGLVELAKDELQSSKIYHQGLKKIEAVQAKLLIDDFTHQQTRDLMRSMCLYAVKTMTDSTAKVRELLVAAESLLCGTERDARKAHTEPTCDPDFAETKKCLDQIAECKATLVEYENSAKKHSTKNSASALK